MPLPFAEDSVLLTPAAFWPRTAPGQLDTATRVVWDGQVKYRLVWEIEYRDGHVIRQYTRSGDQVFQVMFSCLRKTEVKEVRVYDFLRPRSNGLVHRIEVPHGAEIDLLNNCSVTLSGDGRFAEVKRVYTYGWFMPNNPSNRQYHHVDPVKKTVVVNNTKYKTSRWD